MTKKEYIKYIKMMLKNIDDLNVVELIYRIVQEFYTID